MRTKLGAFSGLRTATLCNDSEETLSHYQSINCPCAKFRTSLKNVQRIHGQISEYCPGERKCDDPGKRRMCRFSRVAIESGHVPSATCKFGVNLA